MRTWVLPFAVLLAGAFHPAAAASCTAPAGGYHAAYRVETATNGPKMGIWYPTTDSEALYQYLQGTYGTVALRGQPACGSFPLVVFSHGYTGCGVQSVFFTEELARHGYVVAAPDHKDATCSVDGSGGLPIVPVQQAFTNPQSWTDATYADRRADIESVIAWMGGGSAVSGQVDMSRIGAAGHSLGGYTMLGMVGAWSSWTDPRIKVALLFSPYLNPFLYDNRLANVKPPVMYQGATGDFFITPTLMGSNGAFAIANLPKYFAELTGGSHYSWTNYTCGSEAASACVQDQLPAKQIDDYAFSFLDAYLKSSTDSLSNMTGSGLSDWEHTSTLLTQSAAFGPGPAAVAPNSIASTYGIDLTVPAAAANGSSLPIGLGGTTAVVSDSSGNNLLAPLYFVSPKQVNLLVPPNAAEGPATVSVYNGGNMVGSGSVQIAGVAPALFAAGGGDIVAAQSLQVSTGGGQTFNITFDPGSSAPISVSVGESGGQTYLILYGTGMRGAHSVTASIGSVSVPAVGPFAQSQYAGLDQVNLGPLPRSLKGSGLVPIVLTLDGKTTPAVLVNLN